MRNNSVLTTSLFLLFMFSSTICLSQNLIKNGDFETPTTDELSLTIDQQNKMPEWKFEFPVTLINHTRLFPYSNFQCLLLPAKSDHKSSIRQIFSIEKKGKVDISFAFAASRMESGKLKVNIDGHEIISKDYTDYWIPSETRLTDHMKWLKVKIPSLTLESGNHTIEFSEASCKVVVDKQGDNRDMIEGFLIDDVNVVICKEINYTGVPTLDELSGQLIDTKTLACYPAIGNFHGSVRSSKRLGAFETQFLFGNKLENPAGTLNINGKEIFSQKMKWYPYQIVNYALCNGVNLTSTMRLVFEKKAVLMHIEFENSTANPIILPA